MMEFDEEKGGMLNLDEPVFEFSEKSVRQGFLRRVYSVLFMQLLATSVIVGTFLFAPGLKEYTTSVEGVWITGVSSLCAIVCVLAIACCEGARRKWPVNIICLSVFTFFEAILVGCITCKYDPTTVLTAGALTAFITLGLTLFALQTKYDFTAWGGVLICCLFSLTGFIFISMFLPQSNMMHTAVSAAGAVLFGCYIVFDTQIMLGGKHKYSISPEEYIFAALNLYLDIVNLFLYILSLLNKNR